MIFEDIANVMNARPVKEIMRKTGLTKNRVYSLRMGCTFHMDYELLFALQRMGYEVRVVGRGATLERSESGVGQHIGPGGADDRTRGFAAGETEAYENYLRKLREKIGADFSAPYGVTGTVASAFGSDGGADQWTMPLSAQQMEDLGILYTK